MKTTSIIKTTSALFSASLLLSLSGHAQQTPRQNFNMNREFATPGFTTSDFGARAKYEFSDSFTLPTGATPYSYSLTAKGTVDGRMFRQPFNAANGNVTATITGPNQARLSATLVIGGTTVMSASNALIADYTSPHLIREVRAGNSVPFMVPVGPFAIPCKVDLTAKASIDACLRASAVFTPGMGGLPRVALSAGPELDIAASATASLNVGVTGLSAGVGVRGTVAIGKSALLANVDLNPVPRFSFQNNRVVTRIGYDATASAVAKLPGINGRIDLLARAEVGPAVFFSPPFKVAEFRIPAPSQVTIFGPRTFRLF